MKHMFASTAESGNLSPGFVHQWTCPPPLIDATRLLRIHKYKDPDKVRPVIRQAAENAVKLAAGISSPTACYVTETITEFKDGGLLLPGGIQFAFPAMQERLAGCERLLAFVMTLGPELDQHTINLIEDQFEPLDALFLEASGWLTIEAATRQLAADLKRQATNTGWSLSMRMGPGYEYPLKNSDHRIRWDLSEQKALFEMFGKAPLPVALMSSCAMQPKMSRSGVFGLSRRT